ncbi:MAG: DUF1684 domain-containing protein [Anaerolineales bacterium]|nr:DUF1684 domain-containing protein [Anaerolineales bacterium]
MTELEQFRKSKDDFFKRHPQSPLTPPQRRAFTGLNYFPENPALDLTVTVETFVPQDSIIVQTSTGDEQSYLRYGKFRFQVEGQDVELTLFASDHGFFLPFVDSLRGEETYGAGRYLEPEEGPDGRFHIDFNLAYNPYCAYNENWSCPLTPFENRLNVPIRAGEKLPAGDWVAH